MKDMKEYQAELHQRVELECRTQKQQRRRMLALCLPLVLCLAVGALALPPLLERARTRDPEASPTDALSQHAVSAGDGIQTGGVIPSAGTVPGNGPSEVPADFAFRFTWGCYGVSSYDSESGKLVKTSHATHPEDYVAGLTLQGDQRRRAWLLLSQLNWDSYPAEYDPYNPPDSDTRVASEPNRDLVLWFRAEGTEHSVSCRGICLDGAGVRGYDAKARTFLQICDRLTGLLTGTPEWQALPDYEFYYD